MLYSCCCVAIEQSHVLPHQPKFCAYDYGIHTAPKYVHSVIVPAAKLVRNIASKMSGLKETALMKKLPRFTTQSLCRSSARCCFNPMLSKLFLLSSHGDFSHTHQYHLKLVREEIAGAEIFEPSGITFNPAH